MVKRRQLYSLFVGSQGTGKTYLALLLAKEYLKKNKPVLWVIPDDEEELLWKISEIDIDEDILEEVLETDTRKLDPAELKEYNHKLDYLYKTFREMKGMKKIYCNSEKLWNILRGERKKKSFRDGLIIADDAMAYLPKYPRHFRKTVMRRRQRNTDIFFLCHGLSEIPPSTNSFITDVILYETTDDKKKWTIANPEKYISVVKRINYIAKTKDAHYSERIVLRNINVR